jgi:hypothetical protein
MELNLNGLPNDAVHVLSLTGEDGGIMKFDWVSQVDAVFIHGRLVYLFKKDVPLMLLQPRVHVADCLPNVDLAALTGNSVEKDPT